MAQIPLTLMMKPTFFSPIYRAFKSHPCEFLLLLSCHSPILNSVFQTFLLFLSAFAHAGSSVSKTLLSPLSFPFPWIMPHPLGPCLHITSIGRTSPPEMLRSDPPAIPHSHHHTSLPIICSLTCIHVRLKVLWLWELYVNYRNKCAQRLAHGWRTIKA